jgi:hypothetical protein
MKQRSPVRSKVLQGQVAVVTGASKGIGAAIAEHLAAAGAAVVVNYASSKAGAEAVVKRIRQADGKAVAVQADVSKLEDVRPAWRRRGRHRAPHRRSPVLASGFPRGNRQVALEQGFYGIGGGNQDRVIPSSQGDRGVARNGVTAQGDSAIALTSRDGQALVDGDSVGDSDLDRYPQKASVDSDAATNDIGSSRTQVDRVEPGDRQVAVVKGHISAVAIVDGLVPFAGADDRDVAAKGDGGVAGGIQVDRIIAEAGGDEGVPQNGPTIS